ncbi:MAG: HEAT repeat domain-containing protein [Armatimonadetes bacterium]|nr:HEAT repeat domain-containing protein [Armatimonadota bacterium]
MLKSEEPVHQLEALRKMAEALPLLPPEDAKSALEDIIAVATDASKPTELRRAAVSGLGIAAGTYERAAKVLVQLANDPDPSLRAAVAEAVALLHDKQWAMDIVNRLAKDTDPEVSSTAISVRSEMLARQRTQKALEALANDLGNPKGDASAKAAIQLVVRGAERPDDVLPLLVKALRTSKNPRTWRGLFLVPFVHVPLL